MHERTMDPVSLRGVKIKQVKNSEVILKRTSEVLTSPKKYSAAKVAQASKNTIVRKDVQGKKNYHKILVKAKVIRVCPQVKVSSTLTKKADSTAAARLTLWNENVNQLTLDSFCNFIVQIYRSEKYISL